MNTTLVRGLIAGSFSAVACLGLLAGAPTAHAESCAPVFTDFGDGTGSVTWPDFCAPPAPTTTMPTTPVTLPPFVDLTIFDPVYTICSPLSLDNLEVRAAQTSPFDWQWRFWINGETDGLCNDSLQAEMVDRDTGTVTEQVFHIADVVAANTGGEDYVATLATTCAYDTRATLGATHELLDEYVDQERVADCLTAIPTDTIDVTIPTIPEDTTPTWTPDTTVPTEETTPETAPTTSVESEVPVVTTTVPGSSVGQDLPRTGSDSTALLIGIGMLVLGAGLGFTAVGMTRRHHSGEATG